MIAYTRNLIKIILFFFAINLSGYAQDKSLRLKVLSYNIHYGVGMDSKRDLKRIADVINRVNPDVVGLQEVSDSSMVAELGRMTDMHGVFGASTEKEPPNLYRLLGIPVPVAQLHYGDGILSKHPFQFIGNLSIPSASSSRYQAMCIELHMPNDQQTTLRFITTHFDYLETIGSKLSRKAAIEVIEQAFIDDRQDISYILTGDLNATPESEVLSNLAAKGWVHKDFGKDLSTVPTVSPTKQIDYVLVRPETSWRIIDVEVIQEQQASDHLPILMTLECTP